MILAFDCATATGWCAGEGGTLPILGNVNMPRGDDVETGEFLDFWHRWLQRQFDEIKPTVIVYEGSFIHPNMNGGTMEKLIGLTNVLQMLSANRKIPYFATSPSHVKKILTGSGKSEKPDMMRCAQKCGVNPKTYDEADAFGVWIAAVHHHAKQHQAMWDARLYSGRGLL